MRRYVFVLSALFLFLPAFALAANFDVDKATISSVFSSPYEEIGEITIINKDNSPLQFYLTESFEYVSYSENDFILQPKSSKTVKVFMSRPNRITTFEISISAGDTTIVIPAVIELETAEYTFDALLKIDKRSKKISPGQNLKVDLDFFALEDIGTQKINVEYVIFDQINNRAFSESEEVFVSNRNIKTREFTIPTYLTPGKYVFAVTMNYGSEWSTAKDTFEVEGQDPFFTKSALFVLIFIGLLLVFLMRRTHFHVKSIGKAHRAKAEELRKKRISSQVEKIYKKMHALDEALEHKLITKEKHSKAHKHLKKKVANLTKTKK